MSGIDILCIVLAVVALVCILWGISILRDWSLELGALYGVFPLLFGLGIALIDLVIFCTAHISVHFS